jgi:aspartate aminotransferase
MEMTMTDDTDSGPSKKAGPRIHLNPTVLGLKPSATLAINERSDALRQEGKTITKFGLGQSPFPVPPSVVQALKDNAHQKDYLPVMGLRELCDAVARYHQKKDGLTWTGDGVLIGPGSKELLFIAQLAYCGELIIPTPSWVSYAPQARIIGQSVQWIETQADNDYRLTPAELDRACSDNPEQPRLLILNYPNNPSGSSYPQEELAELAKIARARKLVILSDEIYGEVHHDGEHISIARFYPEGTILSAGLSKWCGAGGWRLGTFLFPPALRWLQDAMGAIASETFTATSAPIQYAAIRAFQGGEEIEQYLLHSRRILKAIARSLVTSFEDAGIRVVKPAGGFYLFLDFTQHAEAFAARGITSGPELTNRLLEEAGVALLPGDDFGRPKSELSARLAYVSFDGEKALAAAANSPTDSPLPRDVLEETCGDVLEGAKRLCNWIKGAK